MPTVTQYKPVPLRIVNLLFLILGALLMLSNAFGSSRKFIHIINSFTDPSFAGRQYSLVPAIPPIITVEQIAGAPLPSKGVTTCKWKQEWIEKNGARFRAVVGDCEDNVKLIVTFVDLQGD